MGPPRHLALLGADIGQAERIPWPVPFADGIPLLMGLRDKSVVVLASGDPFWFGAGTVITRDLAPGAWRAFPGRATFALAASALGWPLEHTLCAGLHAAPLSRLRPELAPGRKAIVLLRDGAAVRQLAEYLVETGFGPSSFTVLEALGGPRARRIDATAETLPPAPFTHPLCVGFEVAGTGAVLPKSAGRAEAWFAHDGQISKAPVRAMTLAALAPRPFAHLWDIGGGSGAVAIEWLLTDPSVTATSIEPRPDRAARIRANADRLGVDRLEIVEGAAPAALAGLPPPDAVFVGGGLNADLLEQLTRDLPPGTRLVANGVTLETEALLLLAQARHGGDLTRLQLSHAAPLGSGRGWKARYPLVQWSHVL